MKRYLTGFSLAQFESVLSIFRQCVMQSEEAGELPPQFRGDMIEEKRFFIEMFGARRKLEISYQYQRTSFSPDSWQLLPTSLVPVRNAIGLICNYQTSRAARVVGDGCLYDPTNLVCEQLKAWLKHLAYCDLSNGWRVKKEIQAYIQYIKMLEQNRVFPCSHVGVGYERTMNSTLAAVTECLEKSCKAIDVQMSQQSMRDFVENAADYSVNVVESLIQYLFYILRSSKAPIAINRNEILNGFSSDLVAARQTRSFMLLEQLVNSPVIKFVNHELLPPGALMQDVFVHLDHFQVRYDNRQDGTMKTPMARHASNLNRHIGGNLIPDRHRLRRWFSRVHSGITGYFQCDNQILEHFIKLHQLTEKMAAFSLLCRDLKEMIDYFGMRTWAVAGKQVLDNFQESFKRLDQELHHSLFYVHEKANKRYQMLLQQNAQYKKWTHNFASADRVYDTLTQGLEGISEQINGLSHLVIRTRQPQADQDARRRLQSLVGALNRFGLFFNVSPIALPISALTEHGEQRP